jgi:hypothetical protein
MKLEVSIHTIATKVFGTFTNERLEFGLFFNSDFIGKEFCFGLLQLEVVLEFLDSLHQSIIVWIENYDLIFQILRCTTSKKNGPDTAIHPNDIVFVALRHFPNSHKTYDHVA